MNKKLLEELPSLLEKKFPIQDLASVDFKTQIEEIKLVKDPKQEFHQGLYVKLIRCWVERFGFNGNFFLIDLKKGNDTVTELFEIEHLFNYTGEISLQTPMEFILIKGNLLTRRLLQTNP